MHVVQINYSFSGTGVENVMRNIGRFLKDNKHEVHYIVSKTDRLSDKENKVIRICGLVDFFIKFISKFSAIIKKSDTLSGIPLDNPNIMLLKKVSINLRLFVPLRIYDYYGTFRRIFSLLEPDIVHGHNIISFGLSPLFAAKSLDIPTVLTIHGIWPVCPIASLMRIKTTEPCTSKTWHDCMKYCSLPIISVPYYMRKLRNKLIENVDMFVTVSDYVRRRMMQFGYPPEKLVTVYNGVNTDLFKPVSDKIENYILHVGRLSIYKGSHIVLKVAKKLAKINKDIKILLAGADINLFKEYAEKLENITFLGHVSLTKLIKLYSESLAVLVPSIRHEPFPLVVLEAMSCSTPVIASNVGGIPEAVIDGKTGFLVEPGNVDVIVRKILYLRENEDERKRLGRCARERVLKEFSLEKMGSKYVELYKKLV